MSTPDFHTHAVNFFLLAEQTLCLELEFRQMLWNEFSPVIPDPAARLPAMTGAVKKEQDSDVLQKLARQPLPPRLSPETVPWYDALVTAWESHRASNNYERRSAARLALVRLEGCGMPDGMSRPSRLPEWLEEARRMVGAGYEPARTDPARTEPARTEPNLTYKRLEALAALAAWRPAPGVIAGPEALRNWAAFWRKVRRSRCSLLRGIGAKALLNLPEANLQGASIPAVPTSQLLHNLARAVPVAAERTVRRWGHDNYLLMLEWQPGENSSLPAAGVGKVARTWVEVARQEDKRCRKTAWRQLIQWDRAGGLNAGGIDLLSFLVFAAKDEYVGSVLSEIAQWTPTADVSTKTSEGGARPSPGTGTPLGMAQAIRILAKCGSRLGGGAAAVPSETGIGTARKFPENMPIRSSRDK